MAEIELAEMAVEDKKDHSAVKDASGSDDTKTLPIPTSSASDVCHKDKLQPNVQSLTNTLLETLSAAVASFGILLYNALPSALQDRFPHFEEKLRQEGKRFSNWSAGNACFYYLDHLVDTSGLVVRRLQRVVERDTDCLTTCPYLQHYSTCPLVCKSSSCSSELEDNVGEDITKQSSAEVFTKNDPESKPESSTPELTDTLVQGVDVSELKAAREYAPRGLLDIIFNLAFTWLVLYPVNAVVALLNFLRSLTHDLYEYRQLPSSYVTAAGRRISSPRRTISSRLLTRTMTMVNEVVNLTAGEHAMPFKLSLDSEMSTLRAVPAYQTRKTTIKRKFCLADDSLFSGDYPDNDYEPVPSAETSSTDLEDSMTVSENDLSAHEEDGFLALKERPTSLKEEGEKSESSNPPAPFKPEPLEI